MIKGKYCAGNEDFNTVLYRYSILMSALNYEITPDTKPEHTLNGGLIRNIRESGYSEAKERLILLYSFGTISEETLQYLSFSANIPLDDIIEAEKLLMEAEAENMSYPSDDIYSDLVPEAVNYEAFENSLLLCANSRTEPFIKVKFKEVYNGLAHNTGHIAVINGICYPDYTLLKLLSEKENELVRYDCESRSGELAKIFDTDFEYSLDELKKAYSEYDLADDNKKMEYSELMSRVPAVRNLTEVLNYVEYIDKLYGKDFIRYCRDEEIAAITPKQYETYLMEQKLRFDFKAFTRKRKICTNAINHFDYDTNEIIDNKLNKKELKPDERYAQIINLDITDIDTGDSTVDLLRKALDKYKNTLVLPNNIIVKTVKDKNIYYMIYDAKKNRFENVNPDVFVGDLFNFDKIWQFIQTVSAKHLIRRVNDNEIVVQIDVREQVDYVKEFDLSERDYEYAKNIIKEQLEKQAAKRVRTSHNLKSLTQLKLDAEDGMKKIAEEKAKKEADKAAKLAARNQGLAKVPKSAEN